MYGFIFGFQRRVWCPKCTPASRSCFILTTAMGIPSFVWYHRDRLSARTPRQCRQHRAVGPRECSERRKGQRQRWPIPILLVYWEATGGVQERTMSNGKD